MGFSKKMVETDNGSVMHGKKLWESRSLRSASDDSSADVSIVKYDIPWEKFRI